MSGADVEDGASLHRERAVLYLAVGLVLVTSPALAGPIGDRFESEPAYTYEAVEVVPENGTLAFEGPLPDDGVEGVDCLVDYSRLCGLEVRQLDGNVTVRQVNPVERAAAPYVEFFDRYYRRARAHNGSHVTYGLRPVPARTVLERVSVPVERTDDPSAVRRIVERESATVGHELADPGRVVAVDGSYYVFDFDRAVTPSGENTEVFVALGATAGLALGLWSLRRGWVHYDRWRGGRRPG